MAFYKKDICVSKKKDIWIDYQYNHMFYITNLMDILPPEIAEDIWKTYWGYEYRKNFVREAMWRDLYMNRVKWAPHSPILHNKKYKMSQCLVKDIRKGEYFHYHNSQMCGYMKGNGHNCENCYCESLSKSRDTIKLEGNDKQLYNIYNGFIKRSENGYMLTWQERDTEKCVEYVSPKVCGVHRKNFNLQKYVNSLKYSMRNGYLIRIR